MSDGLNDALVECVRACGGSKAVGVDMWPTLGVEAAQRKLLNSLNTERPEKLGPEEVLHILKMARDRGCHAGMQYLCAHLSYEPPKPIAPRDEADELRRQILAASRTLQEQLARLEQIERAPTIRAVA